MSDAFFVLGASCYSITDTQRQRNEKSSELHVDRLRTRYLMCLMLRLFKYFRQGFLPCGASIGVLLPLCVEQSAVGLRREEQAFEVMLAYTSTSPILVAPIAIEVPQTTGTSKESHSYR
jgi:hypothetical protein